jgi:hypothetical protein
VKTNPGFVENWKLVVN